jgi:hypothetical protein
VDLANYFWSRSDVVAKYHVYEDGDSENSYEEVQTDEEEDDSEDDQEKVVCVSVMSV